MTKTYRPPIPQEVVERLKGVSPLMTPHAAVRVAIELFIELMKKDSLRAYLMLLGPDEFVAKLSDLMEEK